jgi:hypothetical protein
MEIIPLAYDSFGARSMCTFIKTRDIGLIIDPGVALGPKRYGLPPHPVELKRKMELWVIIKEHVRKSDVVVITHYHYDHHNPEEVEIFRGKTMLIKHPQKRINRSQKGRAAYFLEKLKGMPERIDFADGKRYVFGETEIVISDPVFHGVSNKLGYVIEVFVDDGKSSFLFSSDVEGPIHREQVEFMIKCNPEAVFIDGPMTYMLGYRFSVKSFEGSIQNLKELIDKTNVRYIITDHHLTRDLNWREKIDKVIEYGENAGVKVTSAAGFLDQDDMLLEAMRKELYKTNPV